MLKVSRWIVIILSISIIFIFSIGSIIPPYKESSTIENRTYLTPGTLDISFENFKNGSIFQNINKIFEDQFFKREQFVEFYSLIQYKLGKKKINDRIIGDDNYRFVVHYPTVGQNAIDNLNDLGDYTKEKGIDLFYTLIPTKDLVLMDKIPEYYRNDSSHVFKAMKEGLNENVNFINLYDTIKNAQKDTPQYYMTDHHWNTNGVFTGYKNIISEINKSIPEVGQSYSKDDFTFETYENTFLGSSGRIATISVVEEFDDIDLYYPKFKSEIDIDSNYTTDYPIYHMNYVSEEIYKNDYGVYLGGAYQDLTIKNNASTSDKTAVVVGISYAPPLTILLAEHFKEINYIDLRYTEHESLYSLIDEKNPDAVIFLYYSGTFGDVLYNFK